VAQVVFRLGGEVAFLTLGSGCESEGAGGCTYRATVASAKGRGGRSDALRAARRWGPPPIPSLGRRQREGFQSLPRRGRVPRYLRGKSSVQLPPKHLER
jgi:hypothetical protein